MPGDIALQPERQLRQGRIQNRIQRQRWKGGGTLPFPHDVKNHILISGVRLMFVTAPRRRVEVDFDIPGDWRIGVKLKHGSAKIRSGLVVPKAGMKDPETPAILNAQPITQHALVLPDGLEETLGRLAGFPKPRERSPGYSPLRVNF